MLGYIFILLGVYTTYAFGSHANNFLALIAGLGTAFAAWTQYVIVQKNKVVTVNDDNKYVMMNMISSVIVLIIFIASFFLIK